jgi:hypothetical protein
MSEARTPRLKKVDISDWYRGLYAGATSDVWEVIVDGGRSGRGAGSTSDSLNVLD